MKIFAIEGKLNSGEELREIFFLLFKNVIFINWFIYNYQLGEIAFSIKYPNGKISRFISL